MVRRLVVAVATAVLLLTAVPGLAQAQEDDCVHLVLGMKACL